MTCDAQYADSILSFSVRDVSSLIKHAHIYFCTLISALLFGTRMPRPSVSRSKAFWWVGREAFVAVETLSNWQEVRMWKIAVVHSVGLIFGRRWDEQPGSAQRGSWEKDVHGEVLRCSSFVWLTLLLTIINQFSHVSTTLPGWPKEWSHYWNLSC